MAKKAFLTVDNAYRKIKKKYLTVDGVYRRVKKTFETVNGVYVLRYSSGEVWKKYNASRRWVAGWFMRTEYAVGYTHVVGGYYGNPVSTNFYDDFTFSDSAGFAGTTTSSTGKYKIEEATRVYIVDEMTVNQNLTTADNIYLDIKWRCVASASYIDSYYVYSKGSYVGDVEAEEGQLPTTSTPEATEDNGNRIYAYENGTLYCYEKVVPEEPSHDVTSAVLDEAILDFAVLS